MAQFSVDRWAEAFLHCCDAGGVGVADEAFRCFKTLSAAFAPLEAHLSGTDDAAQAERLARAAFSRLGAADAAADSAREIALRTVLLLMRRGLFARHTALEREISRELDRRNGVASALVETALPLSDELRRGIESAVKEKTGAKEVRLTERAAPELIGGCRLRVETTVIDASVRALLQSMSLQLRGSI